MRHLPLVLSLAALAAAAGPAVAGVPPGGSGPEREVLLALTLPAAAAPPAADVAGVLRQAGRLGLRVVGSTATLVRVRGNAAAVAALFPRQAPQRAGQATSLAVPPALQGAVTAAIDAGSGPRWQRRDDTAAHPTTARELTAAYGVAPLPNVGAPVLTAQTPVVGTLQLSDWDPADLTRYAAQVLGRTDDPVATGQYSPVVVQDPGRTDAVPEVALDQEAVFGAAPQLRQRPYFTANNSDGVLAALDRALADVSAGVPLVSFSTSYGLCELVQARSVLDAMQQRLAALVAAGVTVTAASGDTGRYDCGDISGPVGVGMPDGVLTPGSPFATNPAARGDDGVDFPASSPSVLALGGTRHENGAGPPSPDTVWDDRVQVTATGPDAIGSGGGTSQAFARPSYQAGLAPVGADPQAAQRGGGRLVPDISLDGDPQTGVRTVLDGVMRLFGGTSLASPLAAAHVADLVSARTGACQSPVGLGDLHATLYGAPASSVDVTTRKQPPPTRAAGMNATQDPAAGFDLATGLGTPLWSRVDAAVARPTLVGVCDATAVESSGALRLPVTLDRATTTPVTASYTVTGGTATAGTDFTGTGGTVTVPAGATSADIVVPLLDDAVAEPAETLQVRLTGVSGGSAARVAGGMATGTIADDDAPAPASPTPAAPTSAAATSAAPGAAGSGAAGSGAGTAAVSLVASATFVPFGAPVTLRGRVRRDGVGEAAAAVLVTERYVDQPGKTFPLGQATTGADGSYSLTFRPRYNGTVRAAALGGQAEVPSRVQVTYRSAVAAPTGGGAVRVDAQTRPGFRTGPGRAERVQLLAVDAAGRQLAVLATTSAVQRTFPRNEAQGTNAITFAVRLAPGSYRLVVKVIGTPVNTGSRSRALAVAVP